MTPNDILAQQQAAMDQAMAQNHVALGRAFGAAWWVALLTFFVPLVAGGFVWYIVYLFYCRLRDIANETKRLRIAFETVHGSTLGLKNSIQSSSGSTVRAFGPVSPAAVEGQVKAKAAVPPKPMIPPEEDRKYLPKF
jgi:hypothetical protein